MTKQFVVHTPVLQGELGEGVTLHVGDRIDLLEEPRDIHTLVVFSQLEAQGRDDVYVADFGDGLMLLPKQPDKDGESYATWFNIEEVSE